MSHCAISGHWHFSQYHGCWCPGEVRSQGISSHDIDLVKPRGPLVITLWCQAENKWRLPNCRLASETRLITPHFRPFWLPIQCYFTMLWKHFDGAMFIYASHNYLSEDVCFQHSYHAYPDINIHVAHLGLTWVLLAPGGPHVGPMNLAIRVMAKMHMSLWSWLFPCSGADCFGVSWLLVTMLSQDLWSSGHYCVMPSRTSFL